MRIEHIAIWVDDLEKMRDFYTRFFRMKSNEKYTNSKKGFSSYFLSFDEGARIELMHLDRPVEMRKEGVMIRGLAHFAISLGSKEEVDRLTAHIAKSGHTVIGEPRTTGDGYYESVIEDPEGNTIELTV